MSDQALLKELWAEIRVLRQRLSEIEHLDSAMTTLALRDGIGTPNAADAIGQIYVDSGGTVRIRFSNGDVKEFTTTDITLSGESLDFSDEDMSMYLALF